MSELDDKLMRGCVFALGAMVKAMASTHPEPEKLRAAFGYRSEELMASLLASETDERALGAVRFWLENFERSLPRA